MKFSVKKGKRKYNQHIANINDFMTKHPQCYIVLYGNDNETTKILLDFVAPCHSEFLESSYAYTPGRPFCFNLGNKPCFITKSLALRFCAHYNIDISILEGKSIEPFTIEQWQQTSMYKKAKKEADKKTDKHVNAESAFAVRPSANLKRWIESKREELKKSTNIYEKKVLSLLPKPLQSIAELQYPVISKTGKVYFIDIFIPKYNIAIEVDGSYHDEKSQKRYDLQRTARLNTLGISCIRIKNDDLADRSKLTSFYIKLDKKIKANANAW